MTCEKEKRVTLDIPKQPSAIARLCLLPDPTILRKAIEKVGWSEAHTLSVARHLSVAKMRDCYHLQFYPWNRLALQIRFTETLCHRIVGACLRHPV